MHIIPIGSNIDSVYVIIPVIIFYLVAQKQIIKGVSEGAVK